MRVLVIGFGSIGRRHAANARALGHEVGVQDTDGDRRRQASAGGYVLPAGRWLTDVDAVVVATPARQHVEAMRDWCATPTLVEKPLATHSAAVEQFQHVYPASDVFVGYNWRYHPQVTAWWGDTVARDGQSALLRLVCDTRMSEWPGRDYAEPIVELSHEIDLLRWLRAPLEPRLVHCEPVAGGGYWLRFESGDIVDLRWDAQPTRRIFATWPSGRMLQLWPRFAGPALGQSYLDEMVAFLTWAADGVNRGHCDLAGGLSVLKLCEQAKAMAVVTT